jgi:hypothetical protein
MRNDAMFKNKRELNTFTQALAFESVWNRGAAVSVKLRNGDITDVIFKSAESDTEESCFHTADWSRCWNLDGSSVTSKDFDICFIA